MSSIETLTAPPVVLRYSRLGPFAAGRAAFVVESNVEGALEAVGDVLRDLRINECAPETVTSFRLERDPAAPSTHPWAVLRDGQLRQDTITHDYLLTYLLWEIGRLAHERAAPLVPVHAAALTLEGRSLLLAGQSGSGKSTLAAWLTSRGWGYQSDEFALLDASGGEFIVHPFPRPLGLGGRNPLCGLIGIEHGDGDQLVPASRIGQLAESAPLGAIVFPAHVPGSIPRPARLAPAEALVEICRHLPSLPARGRAEFRAMATVVSTIPVCRLDIDDLRLAEQTLEAVLRAAPR